MLDKISLKIVSAISLVVGIGGSLLSKYVGDQELDAKVDEKVAKKIAEYYKNEKES